MRKNDAVLLDQLAIGIEQGKESFKSDPDGQARMINVNLIDENPVNSEIFSMNEIDSLAENIKNQGFEGGIIVRQKEDGRYEVISGHRRLRAVKQLGDKEIRCFVKKYSDDTVVRDAEIIDDLISSNLTNREISIMEKSKAVTVYINKVLDVTMPDSSKKEKIQKVGEKFEFANSYIYLLLALQKINPRLEEYANMPKFPSNSLVDANVMNDAQVSELITEIEDTEGFAEYKEDPVNNDCPLSVRSLKALIKDILHSENKSKEEISKFALTPAHGSRDTASYNRYSQKIKSFANDVYKCRCQDLTSDQVDNMYQELNAAFESLKAYIELMSGSCNGKYVSNPDDISDNTLRKLSREQIKSIIEAYHNSREMDFTAVVNKLSERLAEMDEECKKNKEAKIEQVV